MSKVTVPESLVHFPKIRRLQSEMMKGLFHQSVHRNYALTETHDLTFPEHKSQWKAEEQAGLPALRGAEWRGDWRFRHYHQGIDSQVWQGGPCC